MAVNFRVDYLRPKIDTALVVTATVRRSGRVVGVVDIESQTKPAGCRRSAALLTPPRPEPYLSGRRACF
jgi:acyl-coenzyme A thioesterase PaaI-like protein